MAKDPNFVSVRLPDDVAELLRAYATDKKLVRAGNPNMGGSIIAILRAALQGQTNFNNVGQSSAAPDIDIQDIIDNALRSKIKELRKEFEEHEKINQAQHQKGFKAQIATFRSEYDAMIEAKIAAAMEATVSAKKSHLQLVKEEEEIVIQKLQEVA